MKDSKGIVIRYGNQPAWKPKRATVKSLVEDDGALGFKLTIYDNRPGAPQDAVLARVIFTCDTLKSATEIVDSQGFRDSVGAITLTDGRSILADRPAAKLSPCEGELAKAYDRLCAQGEANGRLHAGDPVVVVFVVPTKRTHVLSWRWQDIVGQPKRLS